MSDREKVLTIANGKLELYMDGASGTWRLYLPDEACLDLSLKEIEDNPEAYNAEIRLARAIEYESGPEYKAWAE